MKLRISLLLIVVFFVNLTVFGQQKYAIVIHGGAGVMSKSRMNDERQAEYKKVLNQALEVGEKLLKDGATATDVVVEVIQVMENSPLFNAGKGAVFTNEGKNELDASIMEGNNINAGAVAGVSNIKNPINAAREVMYKSEHVFLSGKGASEFAKQQGLEIVNNKYFFTKSRYESLKQLQKRERERTKKDNMGTVGCAVLDTHGNLSAGTSTGGMTNKKFGRIGDAPVIGAGTYANNNTCAVSCTGHGEYYIRLGFARDISALMEYKNLSVSEACKEEINKLSELDGTGGVIAVDANGDIAMEFNTGGMFRGFIKSNGEKEIAIFKEN
ncbi:MAG: isoaspartyl peptidase/L-asparaginase [Prolixibacteraceae bacterium]|jgi:L-asparaginase / beta-aspartyl-peptidase|nr:isoaspartyl peptidase/L-asparaginase [Prolixibacteraceae bacterium]MBT6004372.1 isoaspartyl peptidase/L-asparaginase [Prolixibacteraceae bacterium]MBT6763634.1 isoaspartyl peptidase/L-asparaginase [Prolixibacteraceae bacterium]MBT6999297.1 isoaspartyl peptidase/L-asparaginase [Prolixibacteraceae bacterium]MBT7393193.1 isoaspartyl peptidase/L-asparaginase [Prolixibacteraceae bacterium]